VPDPKRRFEVIEGGTGKRSEQTLIDTGTVDQRVEPKLKRATKSSSGGRGGGGQAVTIAKLEQSVGWAWKAIGLLAVAFGGAFLFFLLRIDDRFDRVDQPLRDLTTNVAVQTETIKSVNDKLTDLRTHLDNANVAQTQTGGKPVKDGKP
jgi:hypothetical protein